MPALLDFKESAAGSIGVELELQIVNGHDYNLTRGAKDLLERLAQKPHPGALKPEITESMIEFNSSVHQRHGPLLEELQAVRDAIANAADVLNLRVSGGGAHPFHRWSDQRIFPTERFLKVSTLYGYLAKQFTVFGQHIHLGCTGGDQALALLHRFARYVPHFIALSASSPFYQGVDTSFDCSRLNTVNAFPLSGHAPPVSTWSDFKAYFDKMAHYGIVESMKDFYWDIRPKPEYGTVELRICDTPLDVELAAALAAYAQALCAWFAATPATASLPDTYDVYQYNRFQACRFGLEATLIEPGEPAPLRLGDDLRATLAQLQPHAEALGSTAALQLLGELVTARSTGSAWLRQKLAERGSLSDVVRAQSQRWMGRAQRPD
jgi:carboxylate-amine ligase